MRIRAEEGSLYWGKISRWKGRPSASIRSQSSRNWVDLPDPSVPSKTISLPFKPVSSLR